MKLLTTPPILSLITISTQIFNRSLLTPKKVLLLTYIITMICVLGTSGTSLYFYLIKNINQQLNRELLTLVQAAAPSLNTIKIEGHRNLDRELPWRNLFSEQEYSLEWYNSNGKLLAREGTKFPKTPLLQTIPISKFNKEFLVFKRLGNMHTATISVYTDRPDEEKPSLQGYIRASEPTQEIDIILNKIRLGLGLGGATAMVVLSFGGIYLTQETVIPMKQGVNRVKTITTDVSHYLRTPLTRISMATEILLSKKDKIQPDEIKKLNIINTAAEQLKRLVEEVLFLIRIDVASSLKERVSLKPLLQDVSKQFEPLAQARDVNLQIQLSSIIHIHGDTTRLTRLFANLLENAIMYTDKGGRVFFSMRVFQGIAVVAVQDTGMGIVAEDLPFIFQGFWRSETAQSSYPEGLGLGLTIADAIVQQHQGEIIVNSQEEYGTSVIIKFPLA